ncbi:hypothetical protein KPH14_005029 [Odynerus spinipes]|uniref:Uncharacterized protein n=1 Tax=Odynerus spinipes TaxID=1348599 RepID=A0AAD9RND0_9HYME|nr:hypothetical protein KPH14_005029 [Odynerus spinipes]
MLEFKILSFHKMLYDMLNLEEKNEYRHGVCMIYEREAQKCAECGSDSFLKIFSRSPSQMLTASPSTKEFLIRQPRRSILKTKHRTSKRMSRAHTPRISIMPSADDQKEEEEEDFSSDVISVSSKLGFLYDKSRSKFLKRSSIAPEGVTDPSRYILLRKFTCIDHRNCHCHDKINCIFWQINQHMEQIGSDENILEFLFAYSAGLIDIAEPSFALKILDIAKERNDVFYKKCQQEMKCDEDPVTNKGLIFVLMGDSYTALGNYTEAKRMYLKAVSLRTNLSKSKITICYKTIIDKLRLRLHGKYPHYFINQYHGPTAHDKLELASYLRRFSSMLMTEAERKHAKLIILQSLRLGFESAGNFLEQGEIYLAAVNIFRRTGNLNFIRRLERPMIEIMKRKIYWCRVEELTVTTNIFVAMYEIRVLRGEFQGAIELGRKILRIVDTINLTHVKLALLPSFIEIMLWTKHICEAIDLMNELYFLSDEDIDNSAITWYYALCLEFLLDAGIFLESYESCLRHAETLAACKTKCCVSRDPESHSRLLTGLWIWQLRMGYMIDEKLKLSADTYTKDVKCDNFSNIFTCSKGLECFLLVLIRCINLKKASQLIDLLDAVQVIVKTLDRVSGCALFIKPHFYFLKSYIGAIRGRKSVRRFNLRKAEKWSHLQNNLSMIAWIMQNKRAATVNNLTEYWIENVAYASTIHWQDIQKFDLRSWATMLYPLPIPNTLVFCNIVYGSRR